MDGQKGSALLTVVLLPGLDGTGVPFRWFAECAPGHLRPMVLSYPEDEVLSYAQLEALVRKQLPDGPFVLLGESFSGPIAVPLASESPAHLKALVLVASFVTPPAWSVFRFLPWGLAFRLPAPMMFMRRWLSPRDPGLAKELAGSIRNVSPRVLASRVRSALAVDRHAQLSRVSCPVLYLQAKNDRIIAKRCLRHILEQQPDARVEVLETSHLVLQVDPKGAWESIVAFLP